MLLAMNTERRVLMENYHNREGRVLLKIINEKRVVLARIMERTLTMVRAEEFFRQ